MHTACRKSTAVLLWRFIIHCMCLPTGWQPLYSLPSEAKLTIRTELEKDGQWVATVPAGQDPKTF